MHSTRNATIERMPEIDVVIERLDARLPGSSANPLLAELTQGKPSLKVLNKHDLADPDQSTLLSTLRGKRAARTAAALGQAAG